MPGRFELYRDRAGAYRFRLKAANGGIVATGQPYRTRQGAAAGIEAVRRAAAAASVEDRTISPGAAEGGGRGDGGGGDGGDRGGGTGGHPAPGSGNGPGGTGTRGVEHVVVFVQENHTTDNYFTAMAAFGANVATDWPVQDNPPAHDQAHTRAAYANWLHAQAQHTPTPATHTAFDTLEVLPYCAWLAATGAFVENHCSGFDTNSTPTTC